jgi:dihydrofolate reductase
MNEPIRPGLTLIAALDRAGAIGRGGALLWHERADLLHFKRTTLGCPVIMGRKTWDSLPASVRPLPGRLNLVVTRQPQWRAAGAERAGSLDEALARVAGEPRVFVIGGGELYAQAFARADSLELTEIDAEFSGADTFFPRLDRKSFRETAREPHHAADGTRYAFVSYRRRG